VYDTILVPTDGSEGAERAVSHALDVAAQYGATVHVLYVADTRAALEFDEAGVDGQMVVDALVNAGERAVERVAADARAAGVAVETAVERGGPVETILDYAERVDADLLVMGTHGRSGLDRVLLGSVTESVVRRSDRPVLTVRRSEGERAG
jgi:nucleotide-binding universal stress UspA family protein